jgi:hypothetical protein
MDQETLSGKASEVQSSRTTVSLITQLGFISFLHIRQHNNKINNSIPHLRQLSLFNLQYSSASHGAIALDLSRSSANFHGYQGAFK